MISGLPRGTPSSRAVIATNPAIRPGTDSRTYCCWSRVGWVSGTLRGGSPARLGGRGPGTGRPASTGTAGGDGRGTGLGNRLAVEDRHPRLPAFVVHGPGPLARLVRLVVEDGLGLGGPVGRDPARSSGSATARISAARIAAFSALPMATVATGIPRGIWTIDRSESRPPRCWVGIGTPITGRIVLAASIPGRWAAPPAPAMITADPAPGRLLGIAIEQVRRAMGRHDAQLVADPQLGQERGGLLEDREVRAAAADDPDPDRQARRASHRTYSPWALVKPSAPSKTWSFSTWVQPGWRAATWPCSASRSASAAAAAVAGQEAGPQQADPVRREADRRVDLRAPALDEMELERSVLRRPPRAPVRDGRRRPRSR